MNVLVLCEESGIVRDAFISRGHRTYSFDVMSSRADKKFHVQGDIRKTLFNACNIFTTSWRNLTWLEWADLVVAFPPCTHLAVSGARWFRHKQREQEAALDFVRWIMNLPVKQIAIENPVSIISSRIRKPDQIIQPWMFGHGETKKTCLWLKNLPKLIPTEIVEGREQRVWKMDPGPMRGRDRSTAYPGIADAMATQWSTQPIPTGRRARPITKENPP